MGTQTRLNYELTTEPFPSACEHHDGHAQRETHHRRLEPESRTNSHDQEDRNQHPIGLEWDYSVDRPVT